MFKKQDGASGPVLIAKNCLEEELNTRNNLAEEYVLFAPRQAILGLEMPDWITRLEGK